MSSTDGSCSSSSSGRMLVTLYSLTPIGLEISLSEYSATTLFLVFYLFQNCNIMGPWNLCNNLLHKFTIRISLSEFCHILQISDGISLALWKSTSYIRGKIVYKLVTPRFMHIDYTTNIMIQKQHICILISS